MYIVIESDFSYLFKYSMFKKSIHAYQFTLLILYFTAGDEVGKGRTIEDVDLYLSHYLSKFKVKGIDKTIPVSYPSRLQA